MTNLLYQELFEKHRLSDKIFLNLHNQHSITYRDYINSVEKISFFLKEKGLIPRVIVQDGRDLGLLTSKNVQGI